MCKKCLTRLMLKDMETHKCGVLQPPLQRSLYRAPPKPRPVVMGEAVSQLLDDEEMARRLQEEEDQKTNRLIARLRQEEPVPHTLAQSPPPAYNAIEEEERRRRREREEEEEEEMIPCDVCRESIHFEDYQKHIVCELK